MLAESVTIQVEKNHSRVKGDYTFMLLPDYSPKQKDTYVLIYVPVMTPDASSLYEEKFGNPEVRVKNRTFAAAIRNDLSYGDQPRGPHDLPYGWSFTVFEAKIPLYLVSETFSVNLEYIQPNFPDGKVAYMPLFPPDDPAKCRIAFIAPDGGSISDVGGFLWFKPKRERLEFTPKHRKLLSVQVNH